MISVKNLHISFEEDDVLQGVNLDLDKGAILGMIGPSGCGKSVLLKAIAELQEFKIGSVALECDQRDVSLMFQEGALFDSLTVFDNVAFPLVSGRVPVAALPSHEREAVSEKVYSVLDRVGLVHAAHKVPGQISGGMRRRVSMARSVVAKPQVLLLDDPTCGLDPVASSVIMNMIAELHAEYHPTVIVVSHDLRRLLPLVDSVACLFDGKIEFRAPLSQIKQTAPERVKDFISCRFEL